MGATAETNKRRPEMPWRCQCVSLSGIQRFDIQGQTEGRVCTLREGTWINLRLVENFTKVGSRVVPSQWC